MRRLVLASRNKGKITELRELLADLPLEVVGLDCYPGAPEVPETGADFAANAFLKAEAIAKFTGELTLADDSGLEVDALGGAPGVFSARYGDPEWDDRQRYEYLLSQLVGVTPPERTARFRSVVTLYDPYLGKVEQEEGAVEGLIIDAAKGENGFGYDPVFYIPELGKTMAELSNNEKNGLSHRGRALRKMLPKLQKFQ